MLGSPASSCLITQAPSPRKRAPAKHVLATAANNLVDPGVKIPSNGPEFDYIEHIRRLSSEQRPPVDQNANTLNDIPTDPLESGLYDDPFKFPEQEATTDTLFGPSSNPISIDYNSSSDFFMGSNLESDAMFSPVTHNSVSSVSAKSSYQKTPLITPAISRNSSFSSSKPRTYSASSINGHLQMYNQLQKHRMQLRQPANHIGPTPDGNPWLCGQLERKIEADSIPEFDSLIKFDDNLKDIIDFSKFADGDSLEQVSKKPKRQNLSKDRSSTGYSLNSYINTLESSLDKSDKQHSQIKQRRTVANTYPTPSSLASPKVSPSSMSAVQPSSITSIALPGSVLLSRSLSKAKHPIRPVCENCLTSTTPLWRRTTDYYKILGVPKNADEKQIKDAYRSLSKKYHPDKNQGDDSAQQKFIEIGEAYEVLNDPEKRAVYDRYGEEGIKNGGNPGGPGRGGDPFDMFSNFFGGAGGRRGRPGKPRGNDVTREITLTLKDFYNGKSMDFQIGLQDICDKCHGTGSEDGEMHTCPVCHGRGRLIQKRQLAPGMIQQFEAPCSACRGSGKKIDHKCSKCHGEGVFINNRKYNIHTPPGLERNHVEVFEGESNKSPNWLAGDLRVEVRESLKSGNLGYRRVGSNLYRTEVLSMKEAINGEWEREIPFLDDYEQSFKIARAEGQTVQDNEVEVIKGKGMPLAGSEEDHGNLYIQYRVIYPGGDFKKLKKIHDEL
ncbi:hypothetical protein FOA43_001332 [Brettanomyces nanus]|uniref:Uncharacterized protein n=1 Tax=Eeniella nana TaxID=13502 RepID=A0A875S103_EENNA|nr:uncharacterized protein FOA43_001332 [Brettanomyces nanus]QPG74015.1 hypothetical protein FOA43_001332 [Brettanomyces nanus]